MGLKKKAGRVAKATFKFAKRWIPTLAEALLRRYTGLEVDLDKR